MSDKKKFKETTVGKLLFGAASMINPTLGKVFKWCKYATSIALSSKVE